MVEVSMPLPAPFNAAERALLRHEFMIRFGQPPSLADGLWLRRWCSGPQAGQPKIPAAIASMLARGLVEIGPDRIGFRARFTPAGVAALRLLAQDRRALDPKQYAHIREELGVDPVVAVDPDAAT
jgi:hypothetical protein